MSAPSALPSTPATCQNRRMIAPPTPPPRRSSPSPMAGGIFLAVLPLAGAWFGGRQGEPVIGLLAGLGAGIIAALIVWGVDRLTRNRR